MKKIFTIMMLILVFTFFTCNVFAAAYGDIDLTIPNYSINNTTQEITSIFQKIWNTVSVMVRIAAVGAVVFAGLRYMFSSADQRADIKKGVIFLCVGATLVFTTVSIVELVRNVFNETVIPGERPDDFFQKESYVDYTKVLEKRPYKNGFMAFRYEDGWRFADETGRIITDGVYGEVFDFSADGYAVGFYNKGDYSGMADIIDKNGTYISYDAGALGGSETLEQLLRSRNLYLTVVDGNYQVTKNPQQIQHNGNKIDFANEYYEPYDEYIYETETLNNGYIAFSTWYSSMEVWGVANSEGVEIIPPEYIDGVDAFSSDGIIVLQHYNQSFDVWNSSGVMLYNGVKNGGFDEIETWLEQNGYCANYDDEAFWGNFGGEVTVCKDK